MNKIESIISEFSPLKIWRDEQFIVAEFERSEEFLFYEEVTKKLDEVFGKGKAFVCNYFERYEGPENVVYLGFNV
jgi:hypothetical protein